MNGTPHHNQDREQAKVLIVSDELVTARVWGYSLSQSGIDVRLIGIEEPVLEIWAEELPDLIVLEDFDSQTEEITLCRELRETTVAPILLLTARTDEAFQIEAYQAGVDECIPFPITPRLFLAKVAAWLRRTENLPVTLFEEVRAGGLALRVDQKRLTLESGAVVRLSALEARLLFLLMNRAGQAVDSDQILARVWGIVGETNTNLLKNLVYRLRRKIEADPADPQRLVTAGGGYMFRPEG